MSRAEHDAASVEADERRGRWIEEISSREPETMVGGWNKFASFFRGPWIILRRRYGLKPGSQVE